MLPVPPPARISARDAAPRGPHQARGTACVERWPLPAAAAGVGGGFKPEVTTVNRLAGSKRQQGTDPRPSTGTVCRNRGAPPPAAEESLVPKESLEDLRAFRPRFIPYFIIENGY